MSERNKRLEELIDSGEQSKHDLQLFLKNVRKYTDPQELTAELLKFTHPIRAVDTENKRLKFITKLSVLSILPMMSALLSMADSV